MRDEIFDKLKGFINELFGADPATLTEDTNFETDLKFKSVNTVQLIASIEDEYDVEVKYMQFKRAVTIGEATDFIVELLDE